MGLPVELNLEGKRVLIVGGGEVAERKLSKVLEGNPLSVRVVAPEVSPGVERLAFEGVEVVERVFEPGDVEGFDIVFVTTDDPDLNRRVAELAKREGAWVNVADRPELCDFFMPAFVRKGSLLITVSTGGSAPGFASALRNMIEHHQPLNQLSRALEAFSKVRREVVDRAFRGRRELLLALAKEYIEGTSCGIRRRIYLIGFSHKTAPLAVREEALRALEGLSDGLEERVLLSTCNRVELYFCSEDFAELLLKLPDSLKEHLYFKAGRDVLKHLALVASGCDSLALGEVQIARQVRKAYEEAKAAGKVGKILSRLFESGFKASKEIRSRTGIQEVSVSVPNLAVKLARKKVPNMVPEHAGVLGTGEMAELILRNLGLKGVRAFGRNLERLRFFEERYRAIPSRMGQLEEVLGGLRVLFVATSSPEPLLTREMVDRALGNGRLLIVDVSVPRNVEECVGELDGVECIFTDDLREVAQEHARKKAEELREAEKISEREAEEFWEWYESLEVEDAVKAFFRKLDEVPPKKLLRGAVLKLKERRELVHTFRELFGL
ncbi:MAG TPA: glutamyl-tRNA reductase [Candidatus Latescibacteria bacterium]|nr:glutamyl-tRNA reductase [Candidatus Latescibacterota bacterium]